MVEGLKNLPMIFLLFGIAAVVAGASVLTVQKFKDTTTNSATLAVLGNATSGMDTMAQQFPTIGIVAAMVIVIGMLMGLFVYTQYFK